MDLRFDRKLATSYSSHSQIARVLTENLQRVFELKANSEEEAIQIVNEKYKNEDIVLDYSD